MTDLHDTKVRARPSGRREGNSGTRAAILDASLKLFSEKGYDATSMRAIAANAGVDPALVRYFFTDKETLFASTVTQRTTVPERLIEAFSGDPAGVGRRITDTYLTLWEREDTRPLLMTLLRASVTTPHAAEMFLETLSVHIDGQIPHIDENSTQERRIALAAAHLLGVAMARHVLRLPVIVQMSHEQLVEDTSPAIQNYLTS